MSNLLADGLLKFEFAILLPNQLDSFKPSQINSIQTWGLLVYYCITNFLFIFCLCYLVFNCPFLNMNNSVISRWIFLKCCKNQCNLRCAPLDIFEGLIPKGIFKVFFIANFLIKLDRKLTFGVKTM